MKWQNLQNNECPRCNHVLEKVEYKHQCKNNECDFFIGVKRFNEIVVDKYNKARVNSYDRGQMSEEERLSELNNM